jgi:urea transporter
MAPSLRAVAQGAMKVLLTLFAIPTLTEPFVPAAWLFLEPADAA